jgi:hypothetical protein
MYVMMNAIMLSIYPGSGMTPFFHKYLFDLGKHIHKKKKKEVEGSRTDECWVVEHPN